MKIKYRCRVCATKFMLSYLHRGTPEDNCPDCGHLTKRYPQAWPLLKKERS